MMAGNVVKKDNQIQVITRVINDKTILNMEPIEEYISKNIMIKYNGEFRTIKEIIQMETDNYLEKRDIIDFD
ncbi:hypothetical protein [Niallia circulans]|uniref:hypothetical protein n=1 Tax=Niallia circulans TaxID=1397 RepID=UPI0026F0B84B|nr:hypothetical protein [Niallia circulans]